MSSNSSSSSSSNNKSNVAIARTQPSAVTVGNRDLDFSSYDDPLVQLAITVFKAVRARDKRTAAAAPAGLVAGICATATYVSAVAFGASFLPAALLGGGLFAILAYTGTTEAMDKEQLRQAAEIGGALQRDHPQLAALATEQAQIQWVDNAPQAEYDELCRTLASFQPAAAAATEPNK
jgi:hypothetical protein